MIGWWPLLRKPQHAGHGFFHLIRLEGLADQRSASVFDWNCRVRVAGEEDEGNAPRRQDRADREARPTIEVDVQDCPVERALAGHLQSAFQPPHGAHRFKAAVAQKLGHHVGHEQVVVANEYSAPMPRSTVASHWLTYPIPPRTYHNTLQAPFIDMPADP